MMEHSPEPWRESPAIGSDVRSRRGGYASVVDDNYQEIMLASANGGDAYCKDADARRIVACVNLLRELPTEKIEQMLQFGMVIRMDLDRPVLEFSEA